MNLRSRGERALIRDVVVPCLSTAGSTFLADDAAVITLDSENSLLITTDSGPRRSFLSLFGVGNFADFGDYCATMSISDIAAMGGQPLGVVAACVIHGDFAEADFARLIHGLAEGCEAHGIAYVGGDTKEGDTLRVITTAVGKVPTSEILLRRGARIDELVCISGALGATLASYVDASQPGGDKEHVCRPRARIELARQLAARRLATACLDISDGPIAAARELAERNDVAIHLDADAMSIIRPRRSRASDEAWNDIVFNVGGDYELMFTIPRAVQQDVEQLGAVVCGTVRERNQSTPTVSVSGKNAPRHVRSWEHFASTDLIYALLEKLI